MPEKLHLPTLLQVKVESDEGKFRLLQMVALFVQFQRDNHREPRDRNEMKTWAATNPAFGGSGGPLNPYEFLSPEQVAEVLRERGIE